MSKSPISREALREFLEEKVNFYNRPEFIPSDPVSIPRRFTRMQDIEIAGLFSAVLAWGQRKTIIAKCMELLKAMDNDPYAFVCNHHESDLKAFLTFKHRTFNPTDALYFISALNRFYRTHRSLEEAFQLSDGEETVEKGLIRFHDIFFDDPAHPDRTRKHLPTPLRKSTCKRMNMYLRWMVRKDQCGVDFGIWKGISPARLVCPCDVHVERVARRLGLIRRKQTDWQTALELTANLRELDHQDPVKYDFALFGLGVVEGFR